MDVLELISLLVELKIPNSYGILDYSELLEEKLCLTCNKINYKYETISEIMETTSNLYFSNIRIPEWKYVLLNLFILKQIGQHGEQSQEMLSVKNNKILRNSLANLIEIAIYSKVQPNLPGYVLPYYTEPDDIFYAYNILKCTSFTLYEFIDFSSLRVAVLAEGLRPIILALFQIAYCPLKMSNLFSQDIYERLLAEKASAVNVLKNLQKKVHPTLFVKESMSLVKPNVALWFKNAVFQTLNNTIVSINGVEVISTAMLDGALNDKTQTWKTIDVISKLIVSCKDTNNFENICEQVFKLLEKTDENNLIYERIFLACLKEVQLTNKDTKKNKFLQKIFYDLEYFINKEYKFEKKYITNKVKQVLRLTYITFVEKGVEYPVLNTNQIVPYLEIFFVFYSITTKQSKANKEAKEIILKTMKYNQENIFDLFDAFLFNFHSKTYPFRNDLILVIKDKSILATESDEYNVTYSMPEKSQVIMNLFEHEPDILFKFFGYLLNCIADKHKYFKEFNRDLLSTQEEILKNLYERKIVVYKLLSDIAENEKVQAKMTQMPHYIIKFIQAILANSIKEKEHEINDADDDKFRSLFTIIMVLHAFISLGSKNKYKDYQTIVTELKIIQKETKNTEFSELIKSILCIIEKEHQPESAIRNGKTRSKFESLLEELGDPLVPVRGHALMSLAKLVKNKDPEIDKRKQYILTIFQQNLRNEDSYIYLAAINGLVELVSNQTDTVLTTLCEEYADFSKNDNVATETRIKLGEVLVKVTKMLGDVASKYKALLLNTFLSGTKDDDYLVRASSLSNLGELCRGLGYQLGTIVTEILVCVHGIITSDKSVEARRAAVTVLRQLLAGLGNDTIAILKEDILPIYRTLKQIYSNDSDDIMRLQAQLALEELNYNMRDFLFPKPTLLMRNKSVLRLT